MKPMKVNAIKAAAYYYERDPIFSRAGEPGGNAVWVGSGASAIGLQGRVDLEAFHHLLYGRDPSGENRLVGKETGEQAHHKNAATDIPLSVPKSFSVAALFDSSLREAVQNAAIKTAEYVEANHVNGRQTVGGETEMVQGEMIAALFMHGTSRAEDAHLHGHLVIENMVIRPDGSFSALENRPIFQHQSAITQTFYSFLAAEAKSLGYGIELHKGTAGQVIPELAGFRQEVNDLFSKRHEAIMGADQLRADLAQRLPHLPEQAIESLVQLQTKSEKNSELTEAGLVRRHTEQLGAIGIDARAYMAQLKETGRGLYESATETLSARNYVSLAVAVVTERESVFSREKALDDAVKLSVGDRTRPELEKAWSEALKAGEIIQYGNHVFTTPEMDRIETRIVEQSAREGRAFAPLFPTDQASQAVQNYEAVKGFSVTAGQKSAIVMALTTEGRMAIIAGDAGSGKSTLFEAVNMAVRERDDVKVIGLGYQGKAAAMLEATSGIRSWTIDSFLLQQPEQGTAGTREIWVVDEASMLGSRHLYGLLEKAEQANAQIILVGDTKQIAAISAGKMMAELQRLDMVNTAVMDEVLRQKTDWTKEIAQALKKHELETAFALLGREGKITELADRQERLAAAAEKYVQAVAQGNSPLAMTIINADRHDLLETIREGQKEAGQIGKEDVTVTTREPVNLQGIDKRLAVNYEAGNLVIFNTAVGPFKEGTEARILASDPRGNSITVSDRDGRPEEVSLRQHGAQLSVLREQETSFAVGERGIFLKNDNTAQGKFLGIKNGVTFTVEKIIQDGTATLKLENGNVVTRNLEGEHVTNGQAITVDKAQGMSEHTGILMASSDVPGPLLNENKNYVGMSRMTHDMVLVTDNRELLMEAIRGEQVKTSTTEFTMTAERLSDLKAETARLNENWLEDEHGIRNEADHAQGRGQSHDEQQNREVTLDL